MDQKNNKYVRIDCGPIEYFLRKYFQYVVIPVAVMGLIMIFIPEEEGDFSLLFIITVFTLLCFSGISFHEYYSTKRKVGTSILQVNMNKLYVNNKVLDVVDIQSIVPLRYNPIIGKIEIYFLEIRTHEHTYYFFDKPRFLIKSPCIDKLQELFPALIPVIMEERKIRELPKVADTV